MARPYRLKRRAERQAETRQRIVDATVELHREIGPARTTVSAIAERAGVQRLTVYRHFPDERALLNACSGQFMEQNPPPNPTNWLEIDNPRDRCSRGLTELYEYYARTEAMMGNVLRDAETDPLTREATAPYHEYVRAVQGVLVDGWKTCDDAKTRLAAAVGHALDFYTWRSLVRTQGLDIREAVELMVLAIEQASYDQEAR
jgi:AcrR family transcriptional regulator